MNLGDAMVKFTNGLLRSNLHRVVAPPGEQVVCMRYALVYFARPGDEVLLRRVEGGSVIPPLEEGGGGGRGGGGRGGGGRGGGGVA